MALFSGVLRSSVLGMDTGLTVVLPYDRPVENQSSPCKIVYLLHGLGENSTSWTRNSNVERYARAHGYALIIPEVQKSFYTDMVYGCDYFTYITDELPKLCLEMFNISSNSKDTYIAGLSMGGYGALKCALTYPEKYRGCASFSALTDIKFLKNQAKEVGMENEVIGLYGEDLNENPENNLKILADNVIKSAKKCPNLYIACGQQDYLYDLNKNYIKYLASISFPFKFEEWQGEHNWDFWDTAIQKAFDFFDINGN